jgi:hypothetical protein
MSEWRTFVNAADDRFLDRVDLRVEGEFIGSDDRTGLEIPWDTTPKTNGPIPYSATAVDRAGNSSSAESYVRVDNLEPEREIVDRMAVCWLRSVRKSVAPRGR